MHPSTKEKLFNEALNYYKRARDLLMPSYDDYAQFSDKIHASFYVRNKLRLLLLLSELLFLWVYA